MRPWSQAWLLAASLLATLPASLAAKPAKWDPVDPAWLAITAPSVEKDAPAEVLEWRVRIQDNTGPGATATNVDHYLRIKIFDERAIDSQAKVDLTWSKAKMIERIAGRTIQPDGTIIPLAEDAIFDRIIAKAGRAKISVKSFALPAVRPGSIIEYQWRDAWSNHVTLYQRLELARDIPVRSVTYRLWLRGYPGWTMKARSFNTKPIALEQDDAFQRFTVTDIPAAVSEPYMPPSAMVNPWVLLFYMEGGRNDIAAFWKDRNRDYCSALEPILRVDDELRRAAATAVGDAATPEARLERLDRFVRSHVKRVDDDEAEGTPEREAVLERKRSARGTLRERWGDALDARYLLAALANAAGLDARLARAADRGDVFLDPKFPDLYFLSRSVVALKVGTEWRFADPAARGLPFGMLPWQVEGGPVLVADPNEGSFVKASMSPAELTRIDRRGTFTLGADGTLEGDVREERTGHEAAGAIDAARGVPEQERRDGLETDVKARLAGAELTRIRFDEAASAPGGITLAYHVRVPGYATRIGRRLLVQPAVFQKGGSSLFPGAERKLPVFFTHAWLSESVVTVDLPEGFVLENAGEQEPKVIVGGDVGRYALDVKASADGRRLECKRTLKLDGEGGSLYFPVASYGPLKEYFDAVRARDDQLVALVQHDASATVPPPATP